MFEKYLEFGIDVKKNGVRENYFESPTVSKVRVALGFTEEQAEALTKYEDFKEFKHIKEKCDKKRLLGFKNEKEFEKWINKNGISLNEKDLKREFESGKFGFGNCVKFYKWYKKQYEKQNGKCEYCGTSKENLKRLLKSKDDNDEKNFKKLFYAKKTSFTAEFQIEKKNPNQPYYPDNCVLACAFCNNAKSDWLNHNNFKLFGDYIKNFIDKLISDLDKYEKLNEMPPSNEFLDKLLKDIKK